MEREYAPWVDRWLDHLLDAYDHDIPSILAENARAIELDDAGELPASVLPLFSIDLEALRSGPGVGGQAPPGQLCRHVPGHPGDARHPDPGPRGGPWRDQDSLKNAATPEGLIAPRTLKYAGEEVRQTGDN